MVEKTPLYNNQLVNANDFSEKFTFKRKRVLSDLKMTQQQEQDFYAK